MPPLFFLYGFPHERPGPLYFVLLFFSLQVCEKYPEWLAVQAEALTKEDYERYGTQYQYFQRIVAVYETEPDNFPRIMELMQDVQQYGQPPAEIIKELAPGLEFNAEGMPVMPGLGATMTPSDLPGMPGIFCLSLNGILPALFCWSGARLMVMGTKLLLVGTRNGRRRLGWLAVGE